MPIEIKELTIKVNVSEAGGKKSNGGSPGARRPIDKKAIVQECVDQVMDILKKKAER